MINAIASSLAGLSVHGTKMGVAAHNVANVNTDEYRKDRVTIHSNASELPEADITKIEIPGYPKRGPEGLVETSNVNLAEEAVSMIVGKADYSANFKVLEAENERIDAVLDLLA